MVYIRALDGGPVGDSGGIPVTAIADRLARASIFSELSERNLLALAKLLKIRRIEAGETIVRRGEGGLGFYLILSGQVEVRKGPRRLSALGTGQFFGEMSLLDDQPRSADVIATHPSIVGVLSRWEFEAFADTHRGVHKGMIAEVVRRLRKTDESVAG